MKQNSSAFCEYMSFHLPFVSECIKGPFTLRVNVCVCVSEKNKSNGIKKQMQKMGPMPIPCVNISVLIDTMLKFDSNAGVDVDSKCERVLRRKK